MAPVIKPETKRLGVAHILKNILPIIKTSTRCGRNTAKSSMTC